MDSRSTGDVESNDNNILGQFSSHQERNDLIKFEEIKVEPYHPEPSCSPLEPSREQGTFVEMYSRSTENVESNDDNFLLGHCSSYQEGSDLIKFEEIKVEPYHPEPSCSPLELVIKEEAEIPMQNDKPTIPLSTSGEQRTYVKLEMKIESDDLGIWEDKPIDFKRTETGSAVPRKSVDEKALQNGMGRICRTHADSTDAEELLKCNVCRKTFARKTDLNMHLRIHTEEKPQECNFRGKTFTQKCDVKHQMEIHKGKKPHECNVCGKTFIRKCNMRLHKMIHTGEKPHACRVCGKAFIHKGSMTLHMRIHTGEKPYKCNDCGKAFTKKSSVRVHMMIHVGEKPYKCSVCKKSFRLKDHMNHHMLTHTGEKPHECDVCGKAYTRKSNVKIHMMIHTGEKPHECSVCGEAFTHRSTFKRHMDIHSNVMCAE